MSSRAILALAVLTLLGVLGALLLLSDDSDRGAATPTAAGRPAGAPDAAPPDAGELSPAALREGQPAGEVQPLLSPAIELTALSGRVVDRDGRPLAGARVELLSVIGHTALRRYRPTGRQEPSGADGRFELADVPSGEALAVQAADELHAPTLLAPIELAPGQALDLGDLVLIPGVRLHGTVSGGDGAPLPGATIAVHDLALGSGDDSDEAAAQGVLVASVVTDAAGAYALQQLGQRQYTLVVSATEHVTLHGTLSFLLSQPEGWEQDFHLASAGGAIAGVVLGSQDQPVGGVGLRILRRNSDSPTYFLADTTSAADGSFRFDDVPEGRFDLTVSAADWYAEREPELTGGRLDHAIRVHPALAVAGRLVGESVPAEFSVTLLPDARTGAALLGNRPRTLSFRPTDTPGRFTFPGLRPGAYAFEVTAPGVAPSRSQDVILGGELAVVEIEIFLRAGGTIVGSVEPALAGVAVELRPGSWDPAFALEHVFPTQPVHGLVTHTDEGGRFSLRHVPEGDYVLSARAEGAPAVHRRDVRVSEGGETDVGRLELLQGGSIRGQVTSIDGAPVPRARVQITGSQHTQATQAGPDGAFSLRAVPAGEYEIWATPENDIGLALRYEARSQVTVYAGGESSVALVFSPRQMPPR